MEKSRFDDRPAATSGVSFQTPESLFRFPEAIPLEIPAGTSHRPRIIGCSPIGLIVGFVLQEKRGAKIQSENNAIDPGERWPRRWSGLLFFSRCSFFGFPLKFPHPSPFVPLPRGHHGEILLAGLRIYLRDDFRWTFTLLDREVSIGRSRENQIVLAQPDISRQHAVIRKDGNQFTVEDKSGRGIQVNAESCAQAILREGDLIQISSYRLIFQSKESEESEEPSADTLNTVPTLDVSLPDAKVRGEGPKGTVLVVVGPDQGKRLSLSSGILKIGRSSRNGFVLSDPSVSSFHLELEPTARGFQVRDLGSTNGTLVQGQRVQRCTVEFGSEIQIGQTKLILVAEDEPGRADRLLGRRLVGKSPQMAEVYNLIERGAKRDVAILIQGETGCGKELVAQEIHRLSARRQGPFITVDCSSIPRDLIESELFGHEKGSFTSALTQRKGAFELGDGGTVFLDEVGELPLELQPKLLRVLEERAFKRVGGNEVRRSDFRVISATNRWLDREVLQGRFRQDLFFRLYVLPILLPPLRERKEDIALLVEHFLRGKRIEVTPQAMENLVAHSWPGNVRELRNTIERAVVMTEGSVLRPEDLLFLAAPPDALSISWEERSSLPPTESLEEIEKRVIERTLKSHGGDKRATAQALGIALSTLYEKLKRFQLAQ